jgi:hypothetical protein
VGGGEARRLEAGGEVEEGGEGEDALHPLAASLAVPVLLAQDRAEGNLAPRQRPLMRITTISPLSLIFKYKQKFCSTNTDSSRNKSKNKQLMASFIHCSIVVQTLEANHAICRLFFPAEQTYCQLKDWPKAFMLLQFVII